MNIDCCAHRNVSKCIRDVETSFYSTHFGLSLDSKRKWQAIREIDIGNKLTVLPAICLRFSN